MRDDLAIYLLTLDALGETATPQRIRDISGLTERERINIQRYAQGHEYVIFTTTWTLCPRARSVVVDLKKDTSKLYVQIYARIQIETEALRLETRCPRCQRAARGVGRIDVLFGWRRSCTSKFTPQSQCRACRKLGKEPR